MARTATRVLLGLLLTGVLVAAGLLAALHLGGATWVVNRILAAVNPYPGTTLKSARVSGNFFQVLRVYDVRLTQPGGRAAIRLDSLRVTYDARRLLAGEVAILEARLDGPAMVLRQRPDSSWDLLDLPAAPDTSAPRKGGPRIRIDRLSVTRGSARVEFAEWGRERDLRIEGLQVEGRAISIGPGVRVGGTRVRLRVAPRGGVPAWVALEARGSLRPALITLDTLLLRTPSSALVAAGAIPLGGGHGRPLELDSFRLHLVAQPLAWRDLRLLRPKLDYAGTVTLDLEGRGRRDGADLRLAANAPDGGSTLLRAFATPPGASPMAARGRITLQAQDLRLFTLDSSPAGVVNGDIGFDLRWPRLDRLDGRVDARLQGSRYKGLVLRRVAGKAALSSGRADVELDGELGPLRTVVYGWLRLFDSVPTYRLTARVARAPHARSALLDRLLGSGGTHLSLRVEGRELRPRAADLAAIAAVVPGAGPPGWLDSGSVRARLRAGALDLRGRVGATGGSIVLRGRSTVTGEPQYRLEGELGPGVNLAALLGSSTPGELSGRFELQGRGTRPRTANARARIFTDAVYGPHQLAGGRFDLELAGGSVRLGGRGFVDGASVQLRASGRPFDAEPSLTVHDMRFRHLDLARVAPAAAVASDLTATVSLRARGRGLGRLHLRGQAAIEGSRIGAATIDSGRVVGSLSRGDLDLRLGLAAPAGLLALEGAGRPFDSIPRITLREGTFQGLELGRILGLEGLRTRLAGTLRADWTGREPDRGTLDATLDLAASEVNQASVREGNLRLHLETGRLRLAGRLMGAGDSLLLDFTAQPFLDPRPVRLAAEAGISELGPLLAREDLDAEGRARVVVQGTWKGRDSSRLEGTVLGSGRLGSLSLDSLDTRLRLADGRLEVDTLGLRSSVGELSGTGTVALRGAGIARVSALRADAKLGDLGPLGSMLGFQELGVDSGGITISLEGPPDRRLLRADARMHDLAIDRRRIGVVRASFEGRVAPDHSVLGGEGDVLLDRIYAPGAPVGSIQVHGSYDGEQLALRARAERDRHRGLRASARLYPGEAAGRVELDTLEVRNQEETWSLAHPVRATWGDRLRIDDFVLGSKGRSIAVDGSVDPVGEQRLRVALDSFPIGWLGRIAGISTLDGALDGSLALSGAAASPRLNGELGLELESRDKAVGKARIGLDWAGREGLELDLGLLHPKGDSLRVSGRVPLALSLARDPTATGLVSRIPDGALQLDASARDFRIDLLEPLLDPLAVKSLRGMLSLDAHARGSLAAPQLSGRMDLTDAGVKLPRLGASYRSGQARATLQGKTIRLDQARILAGDGKLEAQGTVRLDDSSRAALDFTAELTDFRAADAEQLRSTVSGRLQLAGTGGAPRLGGDVQVRNTDLYLQMGGSEHSAEEVELSAADLRQLKDRFGVTPERRRRLGALDPWTLDLDVKLGENTWVRRRTNPAVAVELAGEIAIRKAPSQELAMFGTVRPLPDRSFVDLLGRRFDVTSGEVNLNGPLDSLQLALQAEYRVDSAGGDSPSGVVILTEVSMDSGLLEVALRSRPTMSAADIRSYIATGRAAGTDPTQSSQEQDVASTGASMAVGAALGTIAGGAGRKLGLDVVQILQDRNGGQTLVAGKYVSAPLYLGFRQPIVAQDDPTEPQSANEIIEWELEYDAFRRALLNVQGAGNELRVFLRLRR